MKTKTTALLSFFVVLLTTFAFVNANKSSEITYAPRKANFNSTSKASRIDGAQQLMKTLRANRTTGKVDMADVFQARKEAQLLSEAGKAVNLNWEFMGPDNMGGRTRALVIDKNDPSHLMIGAVSGGIWESNDGASSWHPYDQDFKIANVSAIAQAADGAFYVGTGALHDGQGDIKSLSSFFIGTGLYRLTGNGQSDLLIGPQSTNTHNQEWSGINAIVTHPTDPNTLFVAMDEGLRISTDRGANWSNPVLTNGGSGSPLNQECLDVEIGTDGRVIASFSAGRIFSSPTGQLGTFTLSTVQSASAALNPGRIELAIAPSDPNIVYASVANQTVPGNGASECLHGIFRSRDGGINWEEIGPGGSTSFDMFRNPGVNCQGDYDNTIAVYPNDPGRILVGGVELFRWTQSSVDPAPANGSWEIIAVTNRFAQNGDLYVHADKHQIVFQSNDVVYFATDGGVGRSLNISANSPIYTDQNFGYGVAQLYDIGAGPQGLVIGGTQDNGSMAIGVQFNTGKGGYPVRGGDGFGAEMSNINHSIGFASLYFGDVQRVQGIGTSLSQTNLSLAGVYNDKMDAFCNTGQCSPVFYTSTRLWESFHHAQTRDSVTVSFTDVIEIVPAGRSFNYFSKNNRLPLTESTSVDYKAVSGNADSSWSRSIQISAKANARDNARDTLDQLSMTTNYQNTLYFDAQNGTLIINDSSNMVAFRDSALQHDTVLFYDTLKVEFFNGMVNDTLRLYSDIDSLLTVEVKDFRITSFNFEAKLPDYVQSMLVVGNFPGNDVSDPDDIQHRNIWMTRDVLKNDPSLDWFKIAGRSSRPDPIFRSQNPNTGLIEGGDIIVHEFSRDGNHLFVGTTGGQVYRISGLNDAIDFQSADIDNLTHVQTCRMIGNFQGRAVTGIAIDPNNDDHMVITLGNYGNTIYAYRTTIATTAIDRATAWQAIQGDLPRMPIYDAVIDKNDGDKVLLATEFGVYATEAAFSTANPSQISWVEENIGLGRFPTYAIEQQIFTAGNGVTNEGMIYAGTHGRGVFRTDALVGIEELSRAEEQNFEKLLRSSLKIYPNPMAQQGTIQFQLAESREIQLRVFDLRGKLVLERLLSRMPSGKVEIPFEADLPSNTYLLQIQAEEMTATSKFIVTK